MRKYLLKKDTEDARDFKFGESCFIFTSKLPTSVDLRNEFMPPIFNQLDEGSCTSNGGVGDREYMLKDPSHSITLSRQFLYNVERLMEGTPLTEDSGCQMRTICKALAKYGVCEESYLPYGEENLSTIPSQEAYKNALNYTISAYHRVSTETEMKQALSQGLLILTGITVYSNFEEVKDDGFISAPSHSDSVLGGHCVLLVGYSDAPKVSKLRMILNKITKKSTSKGYFILRNSWSDKSTSEGGWGDKGYGYLPYEVFEKIKGDMWVITK